jgi:hypothetical protein
LVTGRCVAPVGIFFRGLQQGGCRSAGKAVAKVAVFMATDHGDELVYFNVNPACSPPQNAYFQKQHYAEFFFLALLPLRGIKSKFVLQSSLPGKHFNGRCELSCYMWWLIHNTDARNQKREQ